MPLWPKFNFIAELFNLLRNIKLIFFIRIRAIIQSTYFNFFNSVYCKRLIIISEWYFIFFFGVKFRISVLSAFSSRPDLFVSLLYSSKTCCMQSVLFLHMTLILSAYAAPLNLISSFFAFFLLIVASFIFLFLFRFLSKGSMHIMKIAQLKASPCLTPLSILIDSLAKPLTRILAVILL